MPPHSSTAEPMQLEPVILAMMLRTVFDALPIPAGATAAEVAALRTGAEVLVTSLRPRAPLQAMLAARMTALHFAIMECLHRSMLPDLPPTLALRYQANVVRLSRLMDSTLGELRVLQFEARSQAKEAQPQAAVAPPAVAPPAVAPPAVAPPAVTRPAQPSAAAPSGRQNPMPSEASTQPARSPVEMPRPPANTMQERVVQELMARRDAVAARAKTLAG